LNESNSGNKPRILIIHPALAPYRVDIFNAMSKIGELKLTLLTKNNANQHFDQSELLSRLDMKPDYVSRKIIAFNRDFPLDIGERIDGFGPDIVITTEFSFTTCIVAMCKLIRKKKFFHVIWTDDNQESIKKDSIFRRRARWLLTHVVDGWIFISHESQHHYANEFAVTQLSAIVPIIHDEQSFRSQLKQSGELSKKIVAEYDLLGKRVLLFVGRLVEIKGIDLLLRAYADVVVNVDDTMLIIVGEGKERENLEALVSKLEINAHVMFVGRYEGMDLAAWYRVGQIFALASRFERYGAVVNEALLAGLPAVVSKNVGARSLIDEGVNGSVIFPEDTARFTDELIKWLERVKPLAVEEQPVRPNLMNTKFCDAAKSVSNLISALMSKR
jgi:glycosyltransferase involved in cell wall biosynthesis